MIKVELEFESDELDDLLLILKYFKELDVPTFKMEYRGLDSDYNGDATFFISFIKAQGNKKADASAVESSYPKEPKKKTKVKKKFKSKSKSVKKSDKKGSEKTSLMKQFESETGGKSLYGGKLTRRFKAWKKEHESPGEKAQEHFNELFEDSLVKCSLCDASYKHSKMIEANISGLGDTLICADCNSQRTG